ncbi:MAG: transcription antitermination factor NusB [Chitinispirillaceae bacterium]|nr:transcription antitermination factor NusB [Chitinispirillaceae bacterium]
MADTRGATGDARPTNRRKARELALQTLYAVEIHGAGEWQAVFERIADGAFCAPEHKRYARDLVQHTVASLAAIDERLARHAANWELKRMAALDRNILRLAVTELTCFTDVPYKVVIDEAVELAKLYGTDESGKFVNGIIDSVRREGNPG